MRKLIGSSLLLLALGAGLGSCTRIYPVRTLPTWVRGVYIPMVKNKTTEPGIEEVVTRLTQEEFLADGRVNVVKKRDADLEIIAEIETYRTITEQTDTDEVPNRDAVHMVTSLKLYDPYDNQKPIADLGSIRTTYSYNSDPRSRGFDIEPDVKDRVMSILARQIVNKTITGFPVELSDTPKGAPLPKRQDPMLLPSQGQYRDKSAFKN